MEYVAGPDGRLTEVFPDDDDDGELLTRAQWLSRRANRCECGNVVLGSGVTCGARECVDKAWAGVTVAN